MIYCGNASQKMKNIYVHLLAPHFSHAQKNKNSQNWPYFHRNYFEKATSAHRSFWFFWLSITYHKIHVNWLASLNIELQNNFFSRMCGHQNPPSWKKPSKFEKKFYFKWDINASNSYFITKTSVHGYIKHSFYH